MIAHVDRYRFVARAPEPRLEIFARCGGILQGDIRSIPGQHGEGVKRFAHWLLDRKQVPIWGTDHHNPGQIERRA